jgi:hypothetical protein
MRLKMLGFAPKLSLNQAKETQHRDLHRLIGINGQGETLMDHLNEQGMQLHVTILGWLLLVANAIVLLVGMCGFLLLAGIGVASGDLQALAILGVVGAVCGAFFVALAIPGLLAGYGLLKRASWGRVLAIVVGVLGLFNFPVGTVIGVYALWVLLQNAATDYFTPAESTELAHSAEG